MRVLMRTQYAGPGGTVPPGGIAIVSDEEGAALIAGRYAEPVETPEAAPSEVAAPAAEAAAETATEKPVETAEAGNRRTWRRGR